jgi:hypothetical protein
MANITTNTDVDYVQKDFNSTVDAIISFANVNFGPGTSANRLWTNFNADSFSRNWLEIVAFVSDVFFFYFDNQATQSYLQTATVRSAINDIAKQFGFTPASATSASGAATFTVTGPVTIPRGFKVRASNGADFFVIDNIIAVAAGEVTGSVLQGLVKTEQFTAEGLQNEEIELQGPNVIRDVNSSNPADITPQVTVNGNDYSLVSSFIRHNGTDSDPVTDSLGEIIGGGGRVFTLDERPDGTPFIRFGDGVFGRKISSGETVTVTYRTGGGSIGNIPEQTLNTLVDSLPQISSVTNNAEFSGGADEQSIEQLRELIPASLRTLERAVAEQDYSDILLANFSEVFAASTETNNTDPGIDLNIYVVPQGSGITNITDNPSLQNRLANYIDRRKMVTVQFQILDAFGVSTLIDLEVFISATTSRTTATQAIQTALTNFFSLSTGGENGSGIGFAEEILLKDINNIVASVDGVERFEIRQLSYRPRVQQNVVGLTTTYNNSEVSIFPNVTESEWLLAASGPDTRTAGVVLLDNTGLTGYSYTPADGVLQYDFPVDLTTVAPGDLFRDDTLTDFTILGVDTVNSNITLAEGLTIGNTVTTSEHGSIRSGATSFQTYKCFKKTRANATNLSIDSITDNNLNLTVEDGTGTAISARTMLDNSNVFIPGQYATGDFYLVDAAGAIWEILSNTSNEIFTSITAVNDAAIVALTSGEYQIVRRLTGKQVVFQNSVFNIQYNTSNTVFSIGAQFSQIGTIGDLFEISSVQSNVGNLGISLDLISYDPVSGEIRLNGSPNLEGVNSNYSLIDSDGQLFNVVGANNVTRASVFYENINQDTEFVLEDSGTGSQVAQGFQITDEDIYTVVSFNLKREGNILGNLTARIVADDGTGLPDLASPIAVSEPVSVTDISNSGFEKVIFSFVTPPTLLASTQYHLVLNADAGYAAGEQSGAVAFDNTGLVTFTYNSVTGEVEYSSPVNLSNVEAGHFWSDSNGELFTIQSVSDADDQLFIAPGQTVDTSVPSSSSDGSVIINDRVLIGIDESLPAYTDGEFSVFDGAQWSNSTLGPSPITEADAIFSIEGTKTITVDSDLTPVVGPGATTSERYYDDASEISLVLGSSGGTITSAPDVQPTGLGTVASVPNRPVDNFVFRTSRFADDVVNLRANEIPQLDVSDIEIQIFGGVD